MSRSKTVATCALVVLLSIASFAPAFAADVGIAVRAGSQGAGAEIGVGVTKWFTLRGGVYDLSVSESFEEGGIDYDGDLTLGGVGLLADFHPFRNGFRVSAGFFSNNNEIDLEATPTTNQIIGNNPVPYTPMEIGTLTGRVAFDDAAPYLGIGWGNIARGKRVGFVADLGVLKQGSGEVRLEADGLAATIPSFLADLNAEAMEVEDDISDYDLWPVISVGLSVRF